MNKAIENNFSYHAPKEAKKLAYMIVELCPNSREKSLAMTKLEEAIMWANASIAREE